MKHILSTFTIFIFTIPLFAFSEEIEDTGIRVVCGDTKGWNQALVVQSDEPMTHKKAKEFFDDRYPHNNGNFPGTIYFFDSFDLPDKDHPRYETQKQNLLKKTKNGYAAKYEGRLGSGGYKFGFNSGRVEGVSLWYYLKENPTNMVKLSVHLDENTLFAGLYTCQHELFKMTPPPQDEIIAEVMPDDQFLTDSSSDEDSKD